MTVPSRERGVAVPLALLLLVALSLLGSGMLALAGREALASRSAEALALGRFAARGAVVLATDRLERDSLEIGSLWTSVPVLNGSARGVRFGANVQSLGGEWSLVRGWGRAHPMAPTIESAVVLWALRPLDRVAAAAAVLEHGGAIQVASGATILGDGLKDPGEGTDQCAPYRSDLDSVFPSDRLPTSVALPGSERELPALGLLGPEDLRDRVTPRSVGSVSPSPMVESGRCVDADDNWGSPVDPAGPCGGRRTARYVNGDLLMEGGQGQGLLMVAGSLTLSDSAAFVGMVVVGEELQLEPGARIVGLVRTGGDVGLAAESAIEGRLCPALLALQGIPPLYAPIPVPGGAWLRPF